MDIDDVQKQITDLTTKRRHEQSMLAAAESTLHSAQQRVSYITDAIDITQHVSTQVEETVHAQISSIVSMCLESVFGDRYEFKILFENRRGKTEARIVFEQGENQISPMDASGGGVVDVAAFALRISAVILSAPKTQKTIILDEPFRSPSAQYRTHIKNMLEVICERLGTQIIMITHVDDIVTGEVIEVE